MPKVSVKTCEVMQYYDHMDTQDIRDIESRVKCLTNVKTYAIITHDKDMTDAGELKKPHFHAVITFYNSNTIDYIGKHIGVPPQYVNKIKTTTKSAQLYLVHRNNPEKYQYEPSEVVANFDYCETIDGYEPRQNRAAFAVRIASGEIKRYNLFDFVTVDEYAKNKRYYENCFEYRQNKLRGNDRNMKCIFLTGASGTGKTTYAKMIATQNGYNAYISSGGKNPLDNYAGEECIILDDTRSSSWSLTDFLKLTDNYTDSLVGCRYYNKSIAECKMLVVTSVKSLEEFYTTATKEDNEPKIQLYRRFPMVIKLTPDKMFIYAFDFDKQSYHLQGAAVNPTALLHNPAVAKLAVDSFCQAMGITLETPSKPDLWEDMPIDDDFK